MTFFELLGIFFPKTFGSFKIMSYLCNRKPIVGRTITKF